MKAMIIKHPDSNLSYLIVPTTVSPGSSTQKYLSGFSPLSNDQSVYDHIRWKIYRDRNIEDDPTILPFTLPRSQSKLKLMSVVIPMTVGQNALQSNDSEIIFRTRADPIVDCS